MGKMTEKELTARDRRRDIGAELLQAVRQMKAGKAGRVHQVKVPEALEARMRSGLSQAKFARALGVSKRTSQGWEQGLKTTEAAQLFLKWRAQIVSTSLVEPGAFIAKVRRGVTVSMSGCANRNGAEESVDPGRRRASRT